MKYKGHDRLAVLNFMQASMDFLMKAAAVEIAVLELLDIQSDYEPDITQEEKEQHIRLSIYYCEIWVANQPMSHFQPYFPLSMAYLQQKSQQLW